MQLVHTEEVTGSVLVSTTQLDGPVPDHGPAVFDLPEAAKCAEGDTTSTRPPQNVNLTSTLPIHAPGMSSVPFTL
jgi:hypothetical protein